MAFIVMETYTGLCAALILRGLYADMQFWKLAVGATFAEAVATIWHIAVIFAVMRDCKRRLAVFFHIGEDEANKGSWCCLKTQQQEKYGPFIPVDDHSPVSWLGSMAGVQEDCMPNMADLRYHINPYLCKKYLGRDDGNYGICCGSCWGRLLSTFQRGQKEWPLFAWKSHMSLTHCRLNTVQRSPGIWKHNDELTLACSDSFDWWMDCRLRAVVDVSLACAQMSRTFVLPMFCPFPLELLVSQTLPT